MIHDHEERISKLEQNQAELKQSVTDLDRTVQEGNSKTEQDNKILREQNNLLLEKVIEINTRAQEQKHELKLLDKENLWKLALTIGGSVTVIQTLIEYLTK
jgi:uncharacterized protein (DUF3084 family)